MESEGELDTDLESGGTSEEDRSKDLVSATGQTNRIFTWICSGQLNFDGSVNGNLCSNSSKFGESADGNVELLIDKNSEEESTENVAHLEKKCVEGQRKKTNSRKPPKPPRPPKGPSLDAADHKLVREIAQLALRKRARIERIKALKRMKAAKSSASYSTLSAMIITILFCLVIVFQGLSCRSSTTVSMLGSPARVVTRSESLVSIQFYKNFSAHEGDRPNSGSLNSEEGQVSSSPTEKGPSKVARKLK